MMWKPQLEAAKRWHRIFGEELDSLHEISSGAIKNLRAIRNRHYRAMVGHLELLRIIDAARWGEGLTLWHQDGASPPSGVTKPWQGKEPKLRELLSSSSEAAAFEAVKHLHPRAGLSFLLGRLADDLPERVADHRTAEERSWIVRPPQL
jgi:hypothetical protein